MLFFCCPKGGFTIAIYHCSIKIISRGKGKSAVAAAAYRSGEKLINNYDGITHDYTRKSGIAYTEIMLPSHASPDFQNRAVLWNSVEKSKNSQLANKYLAENEITERIDHRSFERQGKEQIPTVHLGVAASQMERKGITTERGNINREIKAHNKILAEIKAKIASLKNWLADIFKRKEKQPPEQNLIKILQKLSKPQKINMQYRIYNPKKLAEQIQYLQDNKIFTVPQLDETVNSARDEYDNIRITLKEVEGRLKSLAELVKQAEIYRRHRDLYKQYHSLSGNKADMFQIRNYTEIALYEAAEKYLKENVNGSTLEVGKWKADIATLTEQKNKLYSEMYKKRDELKIAESIQKSVDTALKWHTRKRNIEYER